MINYQNIFIHTVYKKILPLLFIAGFLTATRVSAQANFAGQIKLTLLGNGTSDHTTIGFNASATSGYDACYDVSKAPLTNSLNPYIATVNTGNDFQTNYYKCGQAAYSIPVRVKQGVAGKCVLIRDSSLVLPSQTCMFLEDKSTGLFEDFIAGSSYSFTISDTTNAPLFVLHIMSAVDYTVAQPACSYSTNGSIFVQAPQAGLWDLTLKDAIGNSLLNHNGITNIDSLKNLSPGVYPIELSGNIAFCPYLQDTIVIAIPAALQVSSVSGSVSCRTSNNGFINATNVSGGTAPYTYTWSNMQNTAVINGLNQGVYTLVLSDANGCKDTSYHVVKSMSDLKADFETDKDTLSIQNAGINTINNSVSYTNLIWNFGDGTIISNQSNPSHTFVSAGIYTVELTASDNICTEKVQKTIVVNGFSGINEQQLNQQISIHYYQNKAQVKIELNKISDVRISVYEVSGKLITQKNVQVMSSVEEVELNTADGMYLIEVCTNNDKTVKKIMALQGF